MITPTGGVNAPLRGYLVGLVAMNGLYFVGVAGLVQRILVTFMVAWLVLIGLRLRSLGSGSASAR